MTRHATFRRSELGFTLIEVMIAVLVLATGFLALTALQGALMRSSADSKARSQVAAYVAGEMERIRTGTPLAPQTATVGGTDDISLAAAAAGLADLRQTIVENDFYCADSSGNFTKANPNAAATCGTNAWFRRVTLNMGWTDSTGDSTRSFRMSTDISPLMLTASKVLVDRTPSTDLGLRPVVRRLTPVTEGMIPIATGGAGDEATAATNPKPKLLGGESGTYVSDTRFDVLTYSAGPSTDFVRFNKKIETAVIGCKCQKGTAGFTGSGSDAYVANFLSARAYRPTYWAGTSYKAPVAALTAVDSSPVNVSQSTLCDICCRDHKDPTTEPGPKYSPWPAQDARHYRLDAVGNYVEAASNGDQYLEACRVIRVDGVFRVAADARVQDNALVATREYPASATTGSQLSLISNNDSATSSRLDDQGKPFYEAYAYDTVAQAYFSTTLVPSTGNASEAYFATAQQNSGLNAPTYVPILPVNDRRWLHSRVFVTDFLEADAKARLKTASTECLVSGTPEEKAQCVLPFLPLASINTTEISFWMPRAASLTDVVPAPVNTLAANYRNYASSSIRRYNSGLALYSAINAAESAPEILALDEQMFVLLAAAAPVQPMWLDVPSPNPNSARFFGDVLNPMRGYAQTSAPIPFRLVWEIPGGNPASPMTDGNKGNDPAATVTASGACTPNPANHTSNPYTCSTASATNVEVTISGFTRIENDSNANNPCGNGKVNKPSCVVYTFTGASVDSPAGTVTASTLVSGTTGHLNEVRKFIIPGVNATTPSTVTLDFTRTTPDTSHTCDASAQPVWSLPCQ